MTVDRDADLESLRTSCLSFISTGSVESAQTLVPEADDPPPYSSIDLSQTRSPPYPPTSPSLRSLTPSTSISNTLHPTESSSSNDGRRKLLLIYIHGFMGSETSFQNFPADVHNLLATLLSESHTVHTKIYPRYRSKKAISVATHDFSEWLVPHESPTTDVVLLGHSLGGILAAEVVLIPSENQLSLQSFRHNILGTLSFDTPFLGMHPGVIKSGLGSIFAPSPPPISQQQRQYGSESLAGIEPMGAIAGVANLIFSSGQRDPNYNPPFANDVRLPVRSGWANAFHFVQKHSKDLRQATQQLVTSHLEFGGCLADMDGLKTRYTKIRLLEEDEESIRKTVVYGKRIPPRIRFANYYTASTGRIKLVKVKSPEPSVIDLESKKDLESKDDFVVIDEDDVLDLKSTKSTVLEEDFEEEEITPRASEDGSTHEGKMRDMEPIAEVDLDDEEEFVDAAPDLSISDSTSTDSTLTSKSSKKLDLPGLPNKPTPPDLSSSDKSAHVRMLMDYARDLKNYRQAIKTYRKTHCYLIKEERKAYKADSKACPFTSDRKKSGEVVGSLEMRNANSTTSQVDTDSLSEASTLSPKTTRQQQLQNDLESQEQNVERCEQKIARLLAKAEKKANEIEFKSVKNVEEAEKKMRKDIEKAERKAEKDREKAERKATKETEKSERKIAKEVDKSAKKVAKEAEKKTAKQGTSSARESTSDLTSTVSSSSSKTLPVGEEVLEKDSKKPKKDRKFCLLPPKDAKGDRDECWVRIYMRGVDEVGAHCGLFFPWQSGEMAEGEDGSSGSSERYAGFVMGVAQKIEEWVGEAATARALSEAAA